MMINVEISRDFNMNDNAIIRNAVSATEAELGDRGRVVLRASGTEPLIRVMIEGVDASQVTSHCESLAEIVRQAAGNSH